VYHVVYKSLATLALMMRTLCVHLPVVDQVGIELLNVLACDPETWCLTFAFYFRLLQ